MIPTKARFVTRIGTNQQNFKTQEKTVFEHENENSPINNDSEFSESFQANNQSRLSPNDRTSQESKENQLHQHYQNDAQRLLSRLSVKSQENADYLIDPSPSRQSNVSIYTKNGILVDISHSKDSNESLLENNDLNR